MRNFILICMLSWMPLAYSQTPVHLTTDLLEYTDRVFLNGYPSQMSLTEIPSAIEHYQTAQIRNRQPSFGWVIDSNIPNTLQQSFQLLVASSEEKLQKNEADMWDSGKIDDDNSISVPYEGKALQTSAVYFWKVKVWDNHGNVSDFSRAKSFMTAPEFDNETARYPLQITNEYPVQINVLKKGNIFVDFGKAAFGKLQITLSAEKEDTVTIHLGEDRFFKWVNRKPDGSIRYAQYRLPVIKGTHTYTVKIKPDGRNTARKKNESAVEPIFMPDYIGEVYPFRYCEVENCPSELTDKDICRQSVHYPFNDDAAIFHSSDTVLNQVWELCKYSIKATSFAGVYVDGDRERIPYEADALINQLCHYAVDREFAMGRYTHEYLLYHPTWPTEWNLQSVLMAWNDYMYTGNKTSLSLYYKDLKAKTLTGLKDSNGLISTRTGKMTSEFNESIHFKGKALKDIVDWPQNKYIGDEISEIGESDNFVFTTYNTVVNAYHYEAILLMSRIAGVLGYDEDQTAYTAEAERVKKQFNRLFLASSKGYYKDGTDTNHSSLHANMFALAFGLVPQKNIPRVLDFIRSRQMRCSVYGAQFLLDAIYEANDAAHGLALLSSTGKRSWYNMIQVGSTITLEAWDTEYKPNLDWSHAWGAVPANIIPRKLMGIEPLEPGFRRIRIKPQPASLRQAFIRVPSIRGDIEVSFENQPGVSFEIKVQIPANSEAEIWLPLISKKHQLWVDDNFREGTTDGAFVRVTVGSGAHVLSINK